MGLCGAGYGVQELGLGQGGGGLSPASLGRHAFGAEFGGHA